MASFTLIRASQRSVRPKAANVKVTITADGPYQYQVQTERTSWMEETGHSGTIVLQPIADIESILLSSTQTVTISIFWE